jgi:hypothetical protein
MKTIGTIFLLVWLLFYASAQPIEPIAIDPATGLPTGTNTSLATQPVKRLQGLDKMADEADLVFKGLVISTHAETNAGFPEWGKPYATKFEVISLLKGSLYTNAVVFLHNTSGPMAWGGGTPPSHFLFEVGKSYIIFAAKADKPDYLYSPSSNNIANSHEFRQSMRGEYAFRTLNSRALGSLSIKEAIWIELNRLINSGIATNSLYAIKHLNMMSKCCLASWGHDDDFKREAVLKVMLPFVTNDDDRVAVSAIGCFQLGGNTGTFVTDQGGWMPILRGCSEVQPECVAQVSPYAATLVDAANKSSSVSRRVAAIAAFSCTRFSIVSNSLPQWLGDAAEQVRAQAVLLLPDFPGEFSEQLLRERATDPSPKVRSVVADAIGNGKLDHLLPTLVTLLSEPVGPTNPIPPLTLEELQSGGQLLDENVGDVHTSAGYALLKFDIDQVGEILKTNLNDAGFRPNYLCKLAENDAGLWLTNLVEVLEARRDRIWKEVEASGAEPKTNSFQALMTLSGTYYRSWNIIYKYLHELPSSEFAGGNLDRCLDALENAGTTGSQEPTKMYELYKTKGLNKRAAKFRSENGKYIGYSLKEFFDKVDAQHPNNGVIPDQQAK